MNTTWYLHSHFVWLKLSYSSIVKTPFRVLGGSRLGVFRWTAGNVKLLLPPRQSRGISYSCLGIPHLVQVGRIALGLHVVAMDEPKRSRVDAVAQSATVLRPVRKYMTEMAVAVRR